MSGRRSGSRSPAPRPWPTHAHSQASFMRVVSHTPALTLYTHPGARTSLHIRLRTDSQEHTLSHTHPLSHTQPLFSAPSYIHSRADNPHSRSETPTRFTYTSAHLHAHTTTHIRTLHALADTRNRFHTPRIPLPRTHSFSRSRTLPTRWRTQIHAKSPLGAHTLAHARLSRRGRSAERGCQVSAWGPRLVAGFSGCGFSRMP